MAKKAPKVPVRKTTPLIHTFTMTNEEAKETYSVIDKEHLPHDKPHYVAMVYRLQRFVDSINLTTKESVDSLGTQNLGAIDPLGASTNDDKPEKGKD